MAAFATWLGCREGNARAFVLSTRQMNLPVEEEVATARSLFHIKWLCIKLPSTGGGTLWEEWLCKDVGGLPSAYPSIFPRFL